MDFVRWFPSIPRVLSNLNIVTLTTIGIGIFLHLNRIVVIPTNYYSIDFASILVTISLLMLLPKYLSKSDLWPLVVIFTSIFLTEVVFQYCWIPLVKLNTDFIHCIQRKFKDVITREGWKQLEPYISQLPEYSKNLLAIVIFTKSLKNFEERDQIENFANMYNYEPINQQMYYPQCDYVPILMSSHLNTIVEENTVENNMNENIQQPVAGENFPIHMNESLPMKLQLAEEQNNTSYEQEGDTSTNNFQENFQIPGNAPEETMGYYKRIKF